MIFRLPLWEIFPKCLLMGNFSSLFVILYVNNDFAFAVRKKNHTANEKEPNEQVKTDNEIIESNEEKKCIYYI